MGTSRGTVKCPEEIRASGHLAINGGTPYLATPPFEDPGICTEAADDVAAVVRSGRTCYWGGGPRAKQLERRFAASLGRRYAFFHSSGSSALITALFAVGAGEGRTVVIGSSGFVAAINAVHHTGARPVFLRTDSRTLQCTAEGYRPGAEPPTALLVTHFLGNVVDVPSVAAVVGASHVVEDGGQAHGAYLGGRPVGTFGDIGSFAGSHKKLVTAGQGGLNVCDSEYLLDRMRMLGHHGKAGRRVGEVPGYNFRGGEMEAVLAMHSLDVLAERAAARNRTAVAIQDALEGAGITTARAPEGIGARPAWFDVGIVLPERWRPHRDWLLDALNAENIPASTYPSLIEMPWVKPWMLANGWWGEGEEELLEYEAALWGRVIVIGTQMSPEDGRRCAEGIVSILRGERS